VDVAVEPTPDAAATREDAWKELAKQAEVENVDDYYFRYGNVVVAYEQVPSAPARATIEHCLD
jgi:hypothetical protein